MTNLHRTLELGQSIWYDNIRKGIIASGELQALITKGVVGITSNPTIFEKAISGSSDYDQSLAALAARGVSAEDIYETLAVDDIRAACELLLPVYTGSAGLDGRVSLEVLPALASNTADTISEGKRLAALVGRPNVMIKVPATSEGLPAIRALTAAGISVNVTLIFSLTQYQDVLEAYIAGVEDRLAAGGSLDGLASVASFFVSRVDSVCDKQLDEKRTSGTPAEVALAETLRGKIAIANAKLAFEIFTNVTKGARWQGLAAKGARPQRLLWASTGTKDKRYPDTLYLDGLIGPDTVNTVPPDTLNAFMDHGTPALTLGEGLAEARAQVTALATLGIDLEKVCRGLLADGVKSFLVSMSQLIGVVSARRAALLERASGRQRLALNGEDAAAVAAALVALAQQKAVEKLWAADPTVFTTNRAHDKSIQSRLGWLRSPEGMLAKVPEIATFARELRTAGRFKRVVLLGMGGSSLCPEVFALSFRGHVSGLALDVLDNTDPAAVLAVEGRGDLKTTLFIVASKSGGTLEIRAFENYFWEQVSGLYRVDGKDDDAATGQHFVAITDPGTALAQRAESKRFSRIFVNPPDIGGRYSALSYFGLVPAALLGIDVAAVVQGGATLATASSPSVPVRDIAGFELGAVLGTQHARGRDKMTLVIDPEIASFGSWIEQLVAESTGKDGKGVVPVDLEPVGAPAVYGPDRLFVRIVLGDGGNHPALDQAVTALEQAGRPVVYLRVPRREDLGREFFRWELATAIAGAVMNVNPFDELDVTRQKVTTDALLEARKATGALPPPEGVLTPADADAIRKHLAGVTAGDYVTFSAFFLRTDARDGLLERLRVLAREKTHAATTVGYGPRFLHSTGQLHKGGANKGVFVQLTANVAKNVPIHGETFDFGTLRDAQALADLRVLRETGRRVIRVHLGDDIDGGLTALASVLTAGLS